MFSTVQQNIDQSTHCENMEIFQFKDLVKQPAFEARALEKCTPVNSKDPGDFYVVPDSINCAYKDEVIGSRIYRLLSNDLVNHFIEKYEDQQERNSFLKKYKSGDLVIVFHKWTGNIGSALRGVIISNTFAAIRPKKTELIDCYIVYLLDHGGTKLVSTKGLYLLPLPKDFLKIPPLAVRCTLHGILPVGSNWSAEALAAFKERMDSELNIQVYVQFLKESTELTDPRNTFMPPEYLVDVIIRGVLITNVYDPYATTPSIQAKSSGKVPVVQYPTKERRNKFHRNVASELVRKKVALEWNPFPRRPSVYRTFFYGSELNYSNKAWWDPTMPHQVRPEIRGWLCAASTDGFQRKPTGVAPKREERRKELEDLLVKFPATIHQAIPLTDMSDLEEQFAGNSLMMHFPKEDPDGKAMTKWRLI